MKAYVLVNPANNRLVNDEIPNYPSCLPKYRITYGPNTAMGITAPEWYKNNLKGNKPKSVKDAGYCAYLGHLKGLLMHLSTNPKEDLLILEDDVRFYSKFNEYFKNFMNMVPSNWDAIYIDGWPKSNIGTEVAPNVIKVKKAYGLSCIILKASTVKLLVDAITEGGSKFGLQVDVALAELIGDGTITAYMPIIKFAYQKKCKSEHFNAIRDRNKGSYRYFNYININGDLVSNSDEDLKRYEDK